MILCSLVLTALWQGITALQNCQGRLLNIYKFSTKCYQKYDFYRHCY